MASDQNRIALALLGLVVGAATGLWLWRRDTARTEVLEWTEEGDAAARISGALARDAELAERGLEVAAISDGVVELGGVVADREQRERAVAVAHNTPGVHTVVNRLVLESEEARLDENRSRREARGPRLHHSGMGVGMGTRRQSPDTDPDRPSDRQKLVDRELDVDRVEPDQVPEDDRVEPDEEPGS